MTTSKKVDTIERQKTNYLHDRMLRVAERVVFILDSDDSTSINVCNYCWPKRSIVIGKLYPNQPGNKEPAKRQYHRQPKPQNSPLISSTLTYKMAYL